ATTGSVTALVSTEGGSLKVGDPIMVSTVAGVGMKASGRVRVIGTAQSPFDGSGDGIAKRTVDTAKGKQEISIGQIPVLIAVGQYNPEAGSNSAVPTWLQDFSNALAGKDVSPLRIVIAGLILLVTLVTVTVLLYAAVRNSIISIGRNPLSRGSVLRSMLEVILISAGIMAVAVIAMYLVITK
ncbi:MAG TPA: hypothetical protein VLF67_02450, partial [Candidatus Saccharimonas sp.]|nr:hypothetical protein [Candidatus Saccharimonas sp.]